MKNTFCPVNLEKFAFWESFMAFSIRILNLDITSLTMSQEAFSDLWKCRSEAMLPVSFWNLLHNRFLTISRNSKFFYY